MATVSIAIPNQLLEKVRKAAASEAITPEEYVLGAVETRLTREQWQKTLDFGERNARMRGIKPEDVATEIAEARSEQPR